MTDPGVNFQLLAFCCVFACYTSVETGFCRQLVSVFWRAYLEQQVRNEEQKLGMCFTRKHSNVDAQRCREHLSFPEEPGWRWAEIQQMLPGS